MLWGQAASAYSLPRQGAPAMSPPIRGARAPRLSAKLCGVSTKRGLELKYRDVEYTVVQGIERQLWNGQSRFVGHASRSVLFAAQRLLSEVGTLPGERAMRR